MFTPLAKLAIGLSATMATAFYYLAAAPSASAQNVCGPENFSPLCVRRRESIRRSQPSLATIPEPVQEVPVVESPAVIADPVQEVPVVESPAVIADPVQEVPVVESPAVIADPVQEVPATEPAVISPPGDLGNIYPSPTSVTPTAIPEPGTVVALLVTGAGIICSSRKRNKQVRQQR
jgi:PEP-CTERM putative exosortase interaction domain